MNKVILFGNVGAKPETIRTESGSVISKFGIAVTEKRKNSLGTYDPVTSWFNVVSFGKRAETIEKFIEKGSKILIEGKLSVNEWQNEAGEKRKSVEVILLNFEFAGSSAAKKNEESDSNLPGGTIESGILDPEDDDDLPF